MSVGWVAATVRARALAGRCLGAERARQLARSPSLDEALQELAGTPYGRDLSPRPLWGTPRRSVSATALWHLRVLAGWLPPGGAGALRALAGWYEVANIEHRMASLAGGRAEPPPYALGSLATSWGRLAGAASTAELRRALAASPWGDPGSDVAEEAGVALLMSWARRLAAEVAPAARWAAGRAALLAASAASSGRDLPPSAAADAERLLGRGWQGSNPLADLAASLPRSAVWALAGVGDPEELWRAELAWWERVGTEGLSLATGPRPGPAPVVGVAAVLMADAWMVGAALEVAARSGDRELAGVLG